MDEPTLQGTAVMDINPALAPSGNEFDQLDLLQVFPIEGASFSPLNQEALQEKIKYSYTIHKMVADIRMGINQLEYPERRQEQLIELLPTMIQANMEIEEVVDETFQQISKIEDKDESIRALMNLCSVLMSNDRKVDVEVIKDRVTKPIEKVMIVFTMYSDSFDIDDNIESEIDSLFQQTKQIENPIQKLQMLNVLIGLAEECKLPLGNLLDDYFEVVDAQNLMMQSAVSDTQEQVADQTEDSDIVEEIKVIGPQLEDHEEIRSDIKRLVESLIEYKALDEARIALEHLDSPTDKARTKLKFFKAFDYPDITSELQAIHTTLFERDDQRFSEGDYELFLATLIEFKLPIDSFLEEYQAPLDSFGALGADRLRDKITAQLLKAGKLDNARQLIERMHLPYFKTKGLVSLLPLSIKADKDVGLIENEIESLLDRDFQALDKSEVYRQLIEAYCSVGQYQDAFDVAYKVGDQNLQANNLLKFIQESVKNESDLFIQKAIQKLEFPAFKLDALLSYYPLYLAQGHDNHSFVLEAVLLLEQLQQMDQGLAGQSIFARQADEYMKRFAILFHERKSYQEEIAMIARMSPSSTKQTTIFQFLKFAPLSYKDAEESVLTFLLAIGRENIQALESETYQFDQYWHLYNIYQLLEKDGSEIIPLLESCLETMPDNKRSESLLNLLPIYAESGNAAKVDAILMLIQDPTQKIQSQLEVTSIYLKKGFSSAEEIARSFPECLTLLQEGNANFAFQLGTLVNDAALAYFKEANLPKIYQIALFVGYLASNNSVEIRNQLYALLNDQGYLSHEQIVRLQNSVQQFQFAKLIEVLLQPVGERTPRWLIKIATQAAQLDPSEEKSVRRLLNNKLAYSSESPTWDRRYITVMRELMEISPAGAIEVKKRLALFEDQYLQYFLQVLVEKRELTPNLLPFIQDKKALSFIRSFLRMYPEQFEMMIDTIASLPQAELSNPLLQESVFFAMKELGGITPKIFERYFALRNTGQPTTALVEVIRTLRTRFYENKPLKDLQLSHTSEFAALNLSQDELLMELIYFAYRPVNMTQQKMWEIYSQITDQCNDLQEATFPESGYKLDLKEITYYIPDGKRLSPLSISLIDEIRKTYSDGAYQESLFELTKDGEISERALVTLLSLFHTHSIVHQLVEQKGDTNQYLKLVELQRLIGVYAQDNFAPQLSLFLAAHSQVAQALLPFKDRLKKDYAKQLKSKVSPTSSDTEQLAQTLAVAFNTRLSKFRNVFSNDIKVFESKITDSGRVLHTYLTKNVGSFFAKASMDICTQDDIMLFNDPNHFQFITVEDQQVVANVLAYIIDDPDEPGKKSLLLRQFMGTSKFRSSVTSLHYAEAIFQIAKQFILENDMPHIYVTGQTDWHELSNDQRWGNELRHKYNTNDAKRKSVEPIEIASGVFRDEIYQVV